MVPIWFQIDRKNNLRARGVSAGNGVTVPGAGAHHLGIIELNVAPPGGVIGLTAVAPLSHN